VKILSQRQSLNAIKLKNSLVSSFLSDFPGAAAAYSLRDLTGNNPIAVRVRRASDNSEQDFKVSEITNGALEAFCNGSDGWVVTIYDQSGNNRHMSNSVQLRQPLLVQAGNVVILGGKPAIFSTTSRQLNNTAPFIFMPDPASVIAVARPFTTATSHPVTANGAAGTSGASYLIPPAIVGNSDFGDSGAGVSFGTNLVAIYQHKSGNLSCIAKNLSSYNSGYIVKFEVGFKTSAVYLNGVLAVEETTVSPDDHYLGITNLLNTTTYGGFGGHWYEQIYYPTASPTGIEDAVNNYYGFY
jgi:hypothetical protein